MKILTGKYRGTKLKLSSHDRLRPTLNRIRSALFDVLQTYLDFKGSLFIDLFAGSGAVGLEALSRGFDKTVFVELDSVVGRDLRANTMFLKRDCYQIDIADVFNWLKRVDYLTNKYNRGVFFLDPPYEKHYYQKIAFWRAKFGKEMPNWILVLQKPASELVKTRELGLCLQVKRYGNTLLDFYRL
ncbi:MAG: 23S rRNA (adenine(2030)-N(6))-methyltransferase RlmJ [SAR324 cluster bacterium]|nr:23S rRNA (adenine(2030)-N(6))-methyltransferase RlmJ [SAR324 cluster bacterium]